MAKKTLLQKVIAGLVEARAYVKKGWAQEWFARTKEGFTCDSSSKNAVCWCVTGALGMTLPGEDEYEFARKQLERTAFTDNIVKWNDAKHRTQRDVVQAFTKTIRRLRAQEARK